MSLPVAPTAAATPRGPSVDPLRSGLAARAKEGGGDPAMQAARLLESLFLRQLVQTLGKDVGQGGGIFGKSVGRNIYQQMFKGALSDKISEAGGFGLAEQLAAQLRSGGAAQAALSRIAAQQGLSAAQGGQEAGAVAGATPTSGAEARRSLAVQRARKALGVTDPGASREGAGGAAGKRAKGGRELGGVAFVDPRRRSHSLPTDADGKLQGPLGGAELVGAGGRMAAKAGQRVAAAASGKVVARVDGGLLVEHSGGRQTLYRGLGSIDAQVGDLVLRGQSLGKVSAEGELRFFLKQGEAWMQPQEINRLYFGAGRPSGGSRGAAR